MIISDKSPLRLPVKELLQGNGDILYCLDEEGHYRIDNKTKESENYTQLLRDIPTIFITPLIINNLADYQKFRDALLGARNTAERLKNDNFPNAKFIDEQAKTEFLDRVAWTEAEYDARKKQHDQFCYGIIQKAIDSAFVVNLKTRQKLVLDTNTNNLVAFYDKQGNLVLHYGSPIIVKDAVNKTILTLNASVFAVAQQTKNGFQFTQDWQICGGDNEYIDNPDGTKTSHKKVVKALLANQAVLVAKQNGIEYQPLSPLLTKKRAKCIDQMRRLDELLLLNPANIVKKSQAEIRRLRQDIGQAIVEAECLLEKALVEKDQGALECAETFYEELYIELHALQTLAEEDRDINVSDYPLIEFSSVQRTYFENDNFKRRLPADADIHQENDKHSNAIKSVGNRSLLAFLASNQCAIAEIYRVYSGGKCPKEQAEYKDEDFALSKLLIKEDIRLVANYNKLKQINDDQLVTSFQANLEAHFRILAKFRFRHVAFTSLIQHMLELLNDYCEEVLKYHQKNHQKAVNISFSEINEEKYTHLQRAYNFLGAIHAFADSIAEMESDEDKAMLETVLYALARDYRVHDEYSFSLHDVAVKGRRYARLFNKENCRRDCDNNLRVNSVPFEAKKNDDDSENNTASKSQIDKYKKKTAEVFYNLGEKLKASPRLRKLGSYITSSVTFGGLLLLGGGALYLAATATVLSGGTIAIGAIGAAVLTGLFVYSCKKAIEYRNQDAKSVSLGFTKNKVEEVKSKSELLKKTKQKEESNHGHVNEQHNDGVGDFTNLNYG